MAKKINIIGIGTKEPVNYDVGTADVERIVHEQHAYNKGRQGDFPAYVVFYEGSCVRSIIPVRQITRINVEVTDEDEQVEIAPELPE